MKKTLKKIGIAIGIIIILMAIGFVILVFTGSDTGNEYVPVGTSLNDIHELYTEEFMYEKISENEEPHKILGDKVKIGKDVVTYSFGGVLQVGVDMDQARYERDGNTITVTFPNWIGINDFGDVHYYKVKQMRLSQVDASNYNQSLLDKDKENIQKEAIEKGILERAKVNLDEKMASHFYEIASMVYTENDDDYYEYDSSDFELEVVIEDPDKVEWK